VKNLEKERRFPDAGVAADKGNRTIDNPPAQHSVHLGNSGGNPFFFISDNVIDGQGRLAEWDTQGNGGIYFPHLFFDKAVPLPAGRTFPQPLR
jgi:hypothetical protein